jgi:hypothetical protein
MRCRSMSPITSASADRTAAGAPCDAVGVHNESEAGRTSAPGNHDVVGEPLETEARGAKWRRRSGERGEEEEEEEERREWGTARLGEAVAMDIRIAMAAMAARRWSSQQMDKRGTAETGRGLGF